MNQDSFNDQLLAFLKAGPSPFHATEQMALRLDEAGFEYLPEQENWSIEAGGRYYTTRNGSSIIAFTAGDFSRGIRMVGAHTDSPCLMVKPQPEKAKNYLQLGVEVYGGALLNPWFDRDLSLAGRVIYRDKASGALKQSLLDFGRAIATIPSLAIHLDREANKNRTVNPQTDIPPILCTVHEQRNQDFRQLLAGELLAQNPTLADDAGALEVLDYELCFYDTQAPAIIGLHDDFIASARLDNLLSCFTGLQALLSANRQQASLLVCTDHEEVGSASASGAQGPMLASVLERLIPDVGERKRCIARSLMVSADNAHGIHPNYTSKHDANHGPLLNGGPVIKINANQRYATNSVTAALFRDLCEQVDVPVQSFVTRTDLGCGSTIGPITAAEIGVPTLDVGVPTFAMHSIRELAGSDDAWSLFKVLRQLYEQTEAVCL
ncbi:MAG: M18 family aminopeptidase [Gammaproteobacteria bacterium]|nr:M18 family aminopeptidase [Gammaproteobacteria bacterium]MBQ0839793.1 M18 family aminopeptidase [Gammaproteobacteria bacterium]